MGNVGKGARKFGVVKTPLGMERKKPQPFSLRSRPNGREKKEGGRWGGP